VAASQRARLERAFTALMAERGYAAVTIGELARRAQVSRGAFYEHFADKEACLLAAYDHFAADILEAITRGITPHTTWEELIDLALAGYLDELQRDLVAARAFIVEMDSAGAAARERRRQAMRGFAAVLRERYEATRRLDPTLGPLPERAFLGLALGVRELVRELLEQREPPPLRTISADVVLWARAMARGSGAGAS
jgi:AcrR family transcriptional regulator